MATAQLNLDFTAIAQAVESTYPIAYLEKANKTYSADTISDKNKIRGIFYHLGSPHVCTGSVHFFGLAEVHLSRLFPPPEWELRQDPPLDKRSFYWGREVQGKGHTWIMGGDRIALLPHPKERAIAIAKNKIQWGEALFQRVLPYASGALLDPLTPLDYYTRRLKEAENAIREGQQELENLQV